MRFGLSPSTFITGCAAVSLLLSSCGGGFQFSASGQSPTEAAIGLIQDASMAQGFGIAPFRDAACVEPTTIEIGAVFECTAATSDQPVAFAATITGEDQVMVAPTNIVSVDQLGRFATESVAVINERASLSLTDDVMDCGDSAVVLGVDNILVCSVSDPDTGQVFDTEITISDLALGTFDVRVKVGG